MAVNIQEMVEMEKKRKEQLAETKLRERLKRQIAIFNKEKAVFKRKTQHEINKQKRSLQLLDQEKMTELENYLSVRSRTTEQLYKTQEIVVKDLVRSTDIVKDLLYNERMETKSLDAKIDDLTKETLEVKKTTAAMMKEQSKYRVPNPFKMDNRVEHASIMYQKQLVKNREIEKSIDDAVKLRELYMKEERKLKKEVEKMSVTIQEILVQTSDIHENRDRAEATKIKVKDHLNKVKDRYERELLTIDLQLSEDKKMEAFMRTKHKDTTQYLKEMREREIQQVDEMMRTKDEYTRAFDKIMKLTGKRDMNVIVHDFIEAEEENFAIFQNIGELLDSNQEMKIEIAEIRAKNVKMEEEQLEVDQRISDEITRAEGRVRDYLWKSDRCQMRIRDNEHLLLRFSNVINPLINFLEMDKSAMPDCFDEDGKIKTNQLSEVLTALEKTVSLILQDYSMIELTTRAIKTYESDITPDEEMICRVPSARILPQDRPKMRTVGLLKEKEDLEDISQTRAMDATSMKNVVVQNLLEGKQETGGDDSKEHLVTHTIF